MRFLPEWQKVVHQRNVEKGFYDYKGDLLRAQACLSLLDDPLDHDAVERILVDYSRLQIERKLLLAIGEICEAHEELRKGHDPNHVYYDAKGKPEGFGMELADTHIRLLDVAASVGVDQDAMMTEKHEYNGTREYRHGKIF